MAGGNGNRSDKVASCDHSPNVAGSKLEDGRQNAIIWALIQREGGRWLISALMIQQILSFTRYKR